MTITDRIISAIKSSGSILICGHIRPDGDCISSALAMRHICRALGKDAACVCDSEKPDGFTFLPGIDEFCAPVGNREFDLFIAVDCANEKRLGIYQTQLDNALNSICIDHHPTNPGYGKINHIDANAASTCSIIYNLFSDSGLINKQIAECLYTGLSTDTGHFMHGNTDSRVFSMAADLCKYGIDVAAINVGIYRNKRYQRVKLSARAINSITLYGEGKIALMTITLDDLAECGCTSEDTEGMIDYASEIRGVQIAISMCEQPGGLFRISLRSKSADVAAVAGVFGGGGHKLAAGCIINGGKSDVSSRIVSAALSALKA